MHKSKGIQLEYNERILSVLTVSTAVILTGQFVLAPLLQDIIQDIGITSTQAGLGLTIMWASGALLMYLGGRSSDGLSRKTVLAFSYFLLIFGFLVLMNSYNYISFIFGLALVGAGVGVYEPTNIATVCDLFTDRRGQAIGMISSAYNIGSALSGALVVVVLWLGGWRLAFSPSL